MNKDKRGYVESVLLVILGISLLTVNYFHEPWFDEAQAWQIARCSSLRDILFSIPRYEGHPAFWYLILMIPAKLGLSYEWSLNVIASIAPILTGALILFKSPFPRLVRYWLPFQYFFFYQYGVIARPYGYMVLALILMALFFKERNARPWRFVFSMLFLCLLGGYGIVLACGICIAWTMEICKEKQWKVFAFSFWKDIRIVSLAVLLISNILIVLQIMPYRDAIGRNVKASNSLMERMVYTLFAMLPDCMITSVFEEGKYLKSVAFATETLSVAAGIGILMLFVIICMANGKNLLYFLIPYTFFAVFSAVVYFYAHHIGIMFAFIVFWLWSVTEEKGEKLYKIVFSRCWQKTKENDAKLLVGLGKVLMVGIMIISFSWTVIASWNDIKLPYFWGRETANFIKDNGLEKASLMSIWDEENVCEMWYPVTILPYFDEMKCNNLNLGDPDKAFVEYRSPNAEEEKQIIEAWKNGGYPDMTIGSINFKRIYGEDTIVPEYQPIYNISPLWTCIWKNQIIASNYFSSTDLYIRKDLNER